MATQNKMLFISGLQSQLWRWYWWCRWWWCEQNQNARGEGGIEAKTVDIREARLLRGDMMAMAPWTCGLWHNMMMMTVSKDQKVVVVHVNTSLLSLLSKHVIPHSASESSKISEKHFFLSQMQSPFCPLRARCYTNKSHFASAASLEKVILGSKISKWGVFSVEEMQTSWNLSFFTYLNILSAFTTQIQNKSSYFVKTKTSLPRIR